MIKTLLTLLAGSLLAATVHSASLTSPLTGNFFTPGETLSFVFRLDGTPTPDSGVVAFTLRNAQGRLIDTTTLKLDDKKALSVAFDAPQEEGFYTLTAESDSGQLTACTLGVLAPANPSAKPDPSSRYGVVAHLKGMDDRHRNLMLDLIQCAGFGWLREGFLWHELEATPGVWTTARYDDLIERSLAHGICVLPVLCFGTPWAADTDAQLPPDKLRLAQPRADAWTNYVRKMLELYGDRVHAWEIWNEPNLRTFWQPELDPAGYADLSEQAAATIREIAPEDTIITAGFSPCQSYLPDAPEQAEERFVRELAARDPLPFNAIGDHPYTVFRHGVSQAETEELFLDNLANVLRGLDETVDDPDNYPLWLTEMGVSTIPRITTEMEAAGYLTTVMTIAAAQSNVERIILYNFRDVGTDPTDKEHMFGLIHHDYTPKPGYFAVRTFIDKVGEAEFTGREEFGGLVVYTFDQPDGGSTEIIWASDEPVEYALPSDVLAVTDATGCPLPVALKDGIPSLTVGALPVYLDY
ncbi:MAG: hypothetical protein Q7Q73_05710 [Verrucomicrobiota bacterium JB024]|nr:hypothetical protein [Verrucomicrobiota bacterium JB024]